jgi:hypothetical protein
VGLSRIGVEMIAGLFQEIEQVLARNEFEKEQEVG